MTRQLKWDQRWLEKAFQFSDWSKDPSTKTGCAVVRENAIIASGYNGFPRGMPDDPAMYADRDVKLRYIVHCDRNAIDQAARFGISLSGATMYLTGPPCADCAKSIRQAGIVRVIWPTPNKFEDDPATSERWAESIAAALDMLDQCSVAYARVEFVRP